MARFGLRLNHSPQLSPQDACEYAALAEARGYEMVWVPEGGGRDSLTQIAAIAGATRRVKLATGILPIFSRTPTTIAMSAAGLAAVSQGRFILGLGTGHRPSAEGSHGISFRRPVTRLVETVEIVRRLLQGEQVSYQGRLFHPSSATLGPAAPPAKVPIYFAALGPQMLELAGEIADGVLLNEIAFSYLGQAIQHIHRGAAKRGRDPAEIDITGYVRVAVVDDPAPVRAYLQSYLARRAGSTFYHNFFQQCGFQEEVAAVDRAMQLGDEAAAARAISERMQDQITVIGNAEECRTAIERRRSLGLQLPIVAPFPETDDKTYFRNTIEAFGR